MSRRHGDQDARRWMRAAALIVLGIATLLGRDWLRGGDSVAPPSAVASGDGEQEVLDLFEARRSGDMVTVQGVVDRVLADDDDGSRHQRFIVRLPAGHTLMIAHNIDLAARVPLRAGDQVRIRGQYEWNERGGLLHWTHVDPDGDHPEGWIEVDGAFYR